MNRSSVLWISFVICRRISFYSCHSCRGLVKCLVPGSRHSTWYQVPGTRYLAPGTRHQVPGTRYQVPGTWYQVPDTWHQEPGTGYQAPGTRYQLLGCFIALVQIELQYNYSYTFSTSFMPGQLKQRLTKY